MLISTCFCIPRMNIRVEAWHLLMCYVYCGTYWCAMCSVASIGAPCAVWHLLVCHVQCGIYCCAMCSVDLLVCHVQCDIYWYAMCSVASIGVSCATNFNLTCFTTRFAVPLQVLLLLYFNNFVTRKLIYNTMREEDVTNGLYVTVQALTASFFSRNCHEIFLEKLRKFPKFLRYDSQ